MLYSENLYASRKPTSLRVSKDREEDTNPLSEIGKGFSAGIDQLQGLIGGGGKALAGSLFGNDEWFVDGMQYYNEQMTDAMRNEAAVGSLEEIDGFVDGINYTAYIIGNLGSSLLGGGISGAAGGAIAKGGLKKIAAKAMDKAIKPSAQKLAKRQKAKNFAKTTAGQEALGKKAVRGQIGGALAFGTAAGAGESFTKVLEEGGEEAPVAALITGVASGALDQITPMRALKRILPQKTFKDASEVIAENIAKQPSMAKRILKQGARNAGTEGAVEGMQEVLQNATLEYIRSDNPEIEDSWLERMTSEDKLSQYLNSAVAGIIGGAAIGGVSGIAKDPRSEISSPTNLLEYDGDANKIPDQRLAEEEPAQNEPPKTEQPEVIDLPQDKAPSLDSLSGQDVTYQGVKGVLTKRDEGFFVVSQNEDIFIESGEAQSPEQLGIIPTDENVVFENDVTIDPESKKFILRGKEFTLTTIRRDDKGNPISLAVRDEKGKNKTIREPEIVQRIEAQINKPQGYTGTLIPLDDLPVSIQEVIVQRGAESGTPINDEVSVDEALEIAELLPETDKQSAVLEIEESVQSSMLFKPTDKKFFSESKYVGSVRRPAQVSLPEAIAEVNKELGAERTPIDEERLKTTLSIANPEVVDGNPVVGAEEFYGDDAPKNEILNAVVDLIEMGMPKSVLNDFQGIGIHDPALHPSMKNSDGSYSMNAGYVSLKKGYVNNLANNASDAERIRYTIAHEIGHAFDVNNNITDNSVEFYAEINGMGANGLDVELGDVLFELGQNYEQKTELGREMSYPFGHIFSWVNARPDKAESAINVLKKEAFAQAFAVLHSNPELLESSAPTTYNYLVKLLREPSKETNQNAQNDNQAEATVGELGEVQGEVRSRAESRGVQVQDREGDQLSRGDGARQEQASPIVEGSPEREDRVDTGQPVQLDSDFQEQQAREEQRLDQEVGQLDIEDDYDPMDDLASFDDDFLFSPTKEQESLNRLQEIDPAYNQAKVRSLVQLQKHIPYSERIAGEYKEGQPLKTISGGRYSDLDLSRRGDGLDIPQADLNSIFDEAIRLTDTNAEGQVGNLAKQTVERLGINANTVEFWDRALQLSDNARYWYEVSAEAMREVLPDLSNKEIKQFISVVAATSPVANPFVNMHRTIASYANYLQGKPIDNDLVIKKNVTDALKTSDLEGLKTGSFGGTMHLVLGMSKPTLSTNDRQVAATFNTDGESIGKNPELYEVMSRFYIGLRDKLNANLPDGAQPYETWQLQALGWVEQRYKNEFIQDKNAEGVSDADALAAYQSASAEEISGGVNDVDDYSMSLLRKDSSGRRDRKGAIQILKEAGIAVPDDKITKEILLDPRVPAALSPTTATFREKRTITAEINSLRNDIGKDARAVFDAAIEQNDQKIADEYHSIFATLLNKSSQGATNPFTAYFKALGLSKVDAKPTRVSTSTGGVPLAVGGTYEGDVSPNIRVPVPASVTSDQLNVLMTSLSKQWDQDAVPASHVIDIADGLREGYTETSQVFVETLDALSRDQIEAFANALPEGVEVNFTRYPNGYEFNVLAFDQEGNPVTPVPDAVDLAAEQMLIADESSITNIYPKDAQWQPAGYSEIQNYDDVFASFKESLYTEQAQNLIGKVQRKQNGKVRDLTEKQIVAALRRKSPDNSLAGQGNARIQRAHGSIKQRLSDFQQAEGIAKSLAEARDTKLNLFIQKNSKKLGVPPQEVAFLSSPPREEDSNISDLSARREQKGLQDFKSRMMNTIQQQVASKNEMIKKLVSDGVFEGFEVGKRYTSKHPNQDTFGFKSEITGLSITEVSKRDRDLNSPTVRLFGQIPESAIIVGDNGKEYTANINTKVINPDGDENISSAALWKVKKQFADGDAKFMGGLRSVQDEDFLSSPPRQESAPNLTPEEANAAQNARIREEKSFIDKATDWASRTFRRNLAPQGLLNDEVFESKIKRDGELGAVEIDIRMHIAAYDEAIKEAYPEGTDVPKSLLNDALQVPVEQLESLDIPKAVKEVIGRMRRYIDKYSADYSTVIQSQLDALDSETQTKEIEAKQSLLSTFKSNLGKYLNRSYRAFDDPNWAKNVPDNVLDDAKAYLERNGATNVERVINTILKEGTAFDGIGSFIVNSKLGAKDLSILKKKNNTIAPEILALLGEYKEPRINFVKTATKLSRLVFNHKFLEDVKAKGEGVFLFTAETAPSDAYVQLAAEQSSVMAPLNGYYVTPELKQGFAEANGLKSLDGMYRNLVALNSIVKYGKTVIAPTTIARNFMSAGFFTVANGHFDWSKTLKSIEVLKSYFNSKEGDPTAFLRELKRLGVVYDTPIAGEMIKAMEDSGVDALENSLIGSDLAKGKIDKAKSNTQKAASFFAKFYQYGDDFWKIVGFQNEMDLLMEAKGLSYEEAAPIAAERIRNTYPTYSLIGRAMQQLRRFPLAGTFVSFPAEIIRTSFNMFKYLKQDMADPDMRASAHRRLAGMALVSGGIYAIQAAAFAAWDVSEEEEEAIRLMSPEWSRNSNIVVTGRDEKGDLEYIDLTYLDPYAYWKRPINALLRDQPVDDALAQSAQEMLSPFFGKDISAGTVFNLMINEKDSGGRIYNPADTASNITVDMTGFMIKNMAPSALQNANRIGKAFFGEVSKSGKKYEMRDEMLALVGFRSTTFDPKVSLHFKAYEFNQDKRDATSLLTSTFRDPNEVSNGDLINAFERASRARREGFERMIKLVSAARSSGLTDTELMMVLRSNGVTRKDARSLVRGDYEAWAMSDSTLKNTIKKSDLLFGEAKGREFEERWKLIQQLLATES